MEFFIFSILYRLPGWSGDVIIASNQQRAYLFYRCFPLFVEKLKSFETMTICTSCKYCHFDGGGGAPGAGPFLMSSSAWRRACRRRIRDAKQKDPGLEQPPGTVRKPRGMLAVQVSYHARKTQKYHVS